MYFNNIKYKNIITRTSIKIKICAYHLTQKLHKNIYCYIGIEIVVVN